MPRHATKTTFKKGDKRLVGKKQSKKHVIRKRISAIRYNRSVGQGKEKVQCDNCGKDIYIKPSEAKSLKHHFCNRKCYKEWFHKIGWKIRKYNLTEEGREKIRSKMLGEKNPRHKVWQKMSEKEREKWIGEMRQYQTVRPTQPEIKMMKIIERNNLPYRYVGDGQFWIRRINPDFVNTNSEKKVIEVFGDYWHRNDNGERKKIFEEFGYECIVVWESELNNLSEKQIVKRITKGDDKHALP